MTNGGVTIENRTKYYCCVPHVTIRHTLTTLPLHKPPAKRPRNTATPLLDGPQTVFATLQHNIAEGHSMSCDGNFRCWRVTTQVVVRCDCPLSWMDAGRNLMQGVLEKLKEREFPWILPGGKLSTTWVLRYYVLRHADIPDPEAFLLEQHEDCTPFSKVRKVLDLRRVVQVDTNIFLKIGSQNWILAIHYRAKHGGKLKVLYLAAHSEGEMNLWITKLCYACKLEKQEEENTESSRELMREESVSDITINESLVMSNSTNNRYFSNNSVSHSAINALNRYPHCARFLNNNHGNCVSPALSHAYIRLKDCSSTRSLGSSSASLSSSMTTSSSNTLDHSASENVLSKNSFPIPPPVPPKPNSSNLLRKNGKFNVDSGELILNQLLSPPDTNEVFDVVQKEWSNETIHPDPSEKSNSKDAVSLTSDHIVKHIACDKTAPKPLPRRRDYHNIPPEIDRSSKPIRKSRNKSSNISASQGSRNADDRRDEGCRTIPRVFPNHFSLQQTLCSTIIENKQTTAGQEVLYGNGLIRTVGGMLDYLDPLKQPLAESLPPIKSLQRSRTSCVTEYTQIDEESTKAVLEANVRQDEIRRNHYQV